MPVLLTDLVGVQTLQLHLLHVGGGQRHVVVDDLQQEGAGPVVLCTSTRTGDKG